MKTQRLNLLEAINLAFAGHTCTCYSDRVQSIQYEQDELTLTKTPTLEHPRASTRILDGRDIFWLKDQEFHAGDDKSIKGYY